MRKVRMTSNWAPLSAAGNLGVKPMLKWLFGVEPMRKWRLPRGFLVGMVCGAAFVIAVDSARSWLEYRSPEDAALYDSCLYQKNGNTGARDALMRVVQRRRTGQ
jgi:hypothetical protein